MGGDVPTPNLSVGGMSPYLTFGGAYVPMADLSTWLIFGGGMSPWLTLTFVPMTFGGGLSP